MFTGKECGSNFMIMEQIINTVAALTNISTAALFMEGLSIFSMRQIGQFSSWQCSSCPA